MNFSFFDPACILQQTVSRNGSSRSSIVLNLLNRERTARSRLPGTNSTIASEEDLWPLAPPAWVSMPPAPFCERAYSPLPCLRLFPPNPPFLSKHPQQFWRPYAPMPRGCRRLPPNGCEPLCPSRERSCQGCLERSSPGTTPLIRLLC